MCDRGPQRPSSTKRCDFVSENQAELLETKANTTRKCPILAIESEVERRSTLGSIHSVGGDEEDIRLSRDDRTDSGIDVSCLEPPLPRLRGNHGCIALLKSSANGARHMANNELISDKLVQEWISALLLPFEKLNFSRPVAQCQKVQATTASCTALPGEPTRQLPRQPQDHITVNVGSSRRHEGSSGRYPNSSDRDNHAPPDGNSGREHEPDGNPEPSDSNEDVADGFPCVYHIIGSDGSGDPTPGCKGRRQYTSQLRQHHFHSSHPTGPFGCCSRCFEAGRWVPAHGGRQEWHRFSNKAEVIEHEKTCIRDICIEETCHNYDQVPSAPTPCAHGTRVTQQQIWRMWYRRAHHLTRDQAVLALGSFMPAASISRQLRPPSAAGLARSQSSPGHTVQGVTASTTPTHLLDAGHPVGAASGSASQAPTPPLLAVSSTTSALARLAMGLLQQLQVNPREPGPFFRETYENILRSSQRLQNNPNLSTMHAEPLERLRNLVEECWRLLTMPLQRTPEAWWDLLLPAYMTLGVRLPPQLPASWYHRAVPPSSTSSDFNDMGTVFGSSMEPATQQQQQQQLYSHDQQQTPASGMTVTGDPTGNLSIPTNTFFGSEHAAQASTSHSGALPDLAIDDEVRRYMDLSHQPWNPVEMPYSRGNPSNAMHNLPPDEQNPSLTTQNNFAFPSAHVYLHPNRAYVSGRSVPTEGDGASQPDSGVYSATQSFSFRSEEGENGKGKQPAHDGAGESMTTGVWH
ncbi:hypothetical protein CKM354_000103200 [Cercospora kikuchii]|uniref:Uncharacterized protein n=1 Tax=Cercospora kikuchii TaxID=84275 RepID=A0A9P3FC96_9PEZI|nr:uncharacterized protein CKM354_000103200 [Cercospora kikuchii]GIZ37589.1 hypothetical protein CKM354_000103200 [Cercospora kikuchii]